MTFIVIYDSLTFLFLIFIYICFLINTKGKPFWRLTRLNLLMELLFLQRILFVLMFFHEYECSCIRIYEEQGLENHGSKTLGYSARCHLFKPKRWWCCDERSTPVPEFFGYRVQICPSPSFWYKTSASYLKSYSCRT